MTLIWRLLRKHISVFELIIFFVANLIGMVVILAGVQIYSDIKPMIVGENSIIENEYVVISKPVERMGYNNNAFTDEDIAKVKESDIIKSMGAFTSAQYNIDGGVVFGGRRMSTNLFFEAIPDEFIDVKSDEWKFEAPTEEEFDSERVFIPIIIPRHYLNLYNFGFSQTSSGLPQLTESFMKDLELEVEISKGFQRDRYVGRIVGLTDRLNTILVPESFIEWSNDYYATNKQGEVMRLILEVDNPSSPEFQTFLKDNNYIAEGKPAESGKALFILKVVVGLIVAIGAVFSILSVIILTLSIYLLLQKNITKLENLTLIGYTPLEVSMPYNILTIVLNVSVLVFSIASVVYLQNIYLDFIGELTMQKFDSTASVAIVAGVIITVANILFNIAIIYNKIKQISRKR